MNFQNICFACYNIPATQILRNKTNGNLRSLENMEVSVRRMVMAMASLSAMHLGGKKRASQEMAR